MNGYERKHTRRIVKPEEYRGEVEVGEYTFSRTSVRNPEQYHITRGTETLGHLVLRRELLAVYSPRPESPDAEWDLIFYEKIPADGRFNNLYQRGRWLRKIERALDMRFAFV